jgi:Mg2+/Co2+ transporter CorB
LLFLSAILSASETAILGSSKIRLHNMVKEGNKQAKVVVKLRRNMGQVISSILIGNTILNIAAGSTATIIMVGFFGEIGAAYATVLMSLLIIFFVEVIPKLYAVNHPEKTAMYVSRILRPLTIIMLPIYMVLEYLAKKTFALFGVTPDTSKLSNTAEELRGMIELHEGPGEEVIHEKAMLRSILDLATVDVGDIMIHRRNVFMLDINSGVENIVQKIKESPHTRVPLWRENPDNVVGILHAKMLFRALQNNNNDFSKINIYEVATSPWFIPFRRRREHFSVVVDEYGVLLGVVTLEDILEEIVGEIVDEHDIEIPGVRVGQDGAIVVLGTVTIRDLNRQFHWELPDEEASTIAGLILFETRQIPDVGQVFNIRGFKVEILRRERNQITLVKISPPIDEPDHS